MDQSPSIVPVSNRDTYLVLDDLGWGRLTWRETNVEDTDLKSVINVLLDGQFKNPVRVIGFNTAERWSRDVSEDIALELGRRCAQQELNVPEFLHAFVKRFESGPTVVLLIHP
jgi:hypothetical protein